MTLATNRPQERCRLYINVLSVGRSFLGKQAIRAKVSDIGLVVKGGCVHVNTHGMTSVQHAATRFEKVSAPNPQTAGTRQARHLGGQHRPGDR